MKKFFIDTEFIEGPYKPLFGKKRHRIDLISIGITDETGMEVELISNEFNPAHASDWVRQNVLEKMSFQYVMKHHGEQRNRILDVFGGLSLNKRIRYIQKDIGLSNETISLALMINTGCQAKNGEARAEKPVSFYGYYCDYDWVLFCSLFGTMMQLPKGYPMYCIDLKQTVDELGLTSSDIKKAIGEPLCEHNALADAIWTKQLYYYLEKVKNERTAG